MFDYLLVTPVYIIEIFISNVSLQFEYIFMRMLDSGKDKTVRFKTLLLLKKVKLKASFNNIKEIVIVWNE